MSFFEYLRNDVVLYKSQWTKNEQKESEKVFYCMKPQSNISSKMSTCFSTQSNFNSLYLIYENFLCEQ